MRIAISILFGRCMREKDNSTLHKHIYIRVCHDATLLIILKQLAIKTFIH